MNDDIPITCHDSAQMLPGSSPTRWRPEETGALDRDGYSRNNRWRACSYCGGMHPADLLKFLLAGASLESADWKYGWPHKFYVSLIPNPLAGQETKVGEKSGPAEPPATGRVSEVIMGKHPATLTGKFYSTHLQDLTADDLAEVGALIQEQTRIEFTRDERGLKYRRPGVPPVSP